MANSDNVVVSDDRVGWAALDALTSTISQEGIDKLTISVTGIWDFRACFDLKMTSRWALASIYWAIGPLSCSASPCLQVNLSIPFCCLHCSILSKNKVSGKVRAVYFALNPWEGFIGWLGMVLTLPIAIIPMLLSLEFCVFWSMLTNKREITKTRGSYGPYKSPG